MKRKIFLSILIVFFVFGGVCDKKENLVITYVKAPLNVPSIVEKEERFFSDEFQKIGMDIEYAEITNGSEQIQALVSGDVDILFAVGAPSVILAASNFAEIKVIDAYSSAPQAYQIVTNDATINCAKDLVGKKIAGPKGTTLNELLIAYLSKGDISINEVEFLPMSIGNAWSALEAGEIDVALIAGATTYVAREEGAYLLTDGEGLIDGTVLVVTTEKFCEKKPEIIARFKKAHREVLNYMKENHDYVMKVTARETGLQLEAIQEMYSYYDFHADLTQRDIQSINKTILFMQKNKMMDKKIKVEDLIYSEEQ